MVLSELHASEDTHFRISNYEMNELTTHISAQLVALRINIESLPSGPGQVNRNLKCCTKSTIRRVTSTGASNVIDNLAKTFRTGLSTSR